MSAFDWARKKGPMERIDFEQLFCTEAILLLGMTDDAVKYEHVARFIKAITENEDFGDQSELRNQLFRMELVDEPFERIVFICEYDRSIGRDIIFRLHAGRLFQERQRGTFGSPAEDRGIVDWARAIGKQAEPESFDLREYFEGLVEYVVEITGDGAVVADIVDDLVGECKAILIRELTERLEDIPEMRESAARASSMMEMLTGAITGKIAEAIGLPEEAIQVVDGGTINPDVPLEHQGNETLDEIAEEPPEEHGQEEEATSDTSTGEEETTTLPGLARPENQATAMIRQAISAAFPPSDKEAEDATLATQRKDTIRSWMNRIPELMLEVDGYDTVPLLSVVMERADMDLPSIIQLMRQGNVSLDFEPANAN